MTKENKFKIGLALQGIALAMDDKTLDRSKERLKLIEDIIIAEPTGDEKPFDIKTYCKEHFVVMIDKDVWEKAEKALKQNPKTGNWVDKKCSICGCKSMLGMCIENYCPNCGARMVEPQESELENPFNDSRFGG